MRGRSGIGECGYRPAITAVSATVLVSSQTFCTLIMANSRLWVIGGFSNSLNYLNDVWSSPDGLNWTQATGAAAFSSRAYHVATVFHGRMWVIGGADTNNTKNDVWSSADGITWTQATASAPFTPRIKLEALTLNDQLCVVAGDDGTRTHDMWCSADGAQWRVAASANMQF